MSFEKQFGPLNDDDQEYNNWCEQNHLDAAKMSFKKQFGPLNKEDQEYNNWWAQNHLDAAKMGLEMTQLYQKIDNSTNEKEKMDSKKQLDVCRENMLIWEKWLKDTMQTFPTYKAQQKEYELGENN
jgi:uncharacterized coiled-coil DUF342 family protein